MRIEPDGGPLAGDFRLVIDGHRASRLAVIH
jgi:hypothetical protein